MQSWKIQTISDACAGISKLSIGLETCGEGKPAVPSVSLTRIIANYMLHLGLFWFHPGWASHVKPLKENSTTLIVLFRPDGQRATNIIIIIGEHTHSLAYFRGNIITDPHWGDRAVS